MKEKNDIQNVPETEGMHIPPLDIIDLDSDESIDLAASSKNESRTTPASESVSDDFDTEDNDTEAEEAHSSLMDKLPPWVSRINFHIVFLVLVVLLFVGIIWKFSDWGVMIHQDDIFSDGKGSYDNSYDMMLPAFDENGDPVYPKYDENTQILLFGNNPFADDRDSEDNLANIIRKETGFTVYNCSVNDSYLSALHPFLYTEEAPHDVYNFYWLCQIATTHVMDQLYAEGIRYLGDDAPPEAMEVYNTIKSVDFNEIDVIGIMYDGTDYLAGLGMYNDYNATDIETFTGNLTAGIELLREHYPHIRFIVMSPTYTYGLDEEGNYVSSDIQTYGQHFLSTYVIKQAEACSTMAVTFVDNLYGTITEDTADIYLQDHYRLNVEGRKLVAQRFIDALLYYNNHE